MRPALVVEGEFDASVMRRVLDVAGPHLDNWVEIVSAGGSSAAESIARSVLVSRPNPVALALDADEIDPSRIADRRRFLETSLGMYGGDKKRSIVTLFIPSIEALFLRRLGSVTSRALTKRQRDKAKVRPRDVLLELLHEVPKTVDIIDEVLRPNWDVVSQEPELRGLISFLRRQVAADS